jgi:hypothetical protein
VRKTDNDVKESKEKNMPDYGREETPNFSFNYDCEVLLKKTNLEQAKDSSFPNDAYLIWYIEDENEYIDLVRGKRTSIFDMYYDTYGPGSVKKIDFGYGRVSPKLWGYKAPKGNKRK